MMPGYMGEFITLYEHDSDCCTYLGVYIHHSSHYEGEYDLYTCLQGGYRPPTILARYGNEGPEYYSGLCFAAENRNPVLWEGAKRAFALGLLTQEEWDKEINHSQYVPVRIESAGTVENGVLTSYVSFEAMDDCPECSEEMEWDPVERMYYCPNTWEHG